MAINKITTKSIKDLEISAADLAPGTITGAKIASATIANDRLANTGITINGTSIALGASGEIVAGTDWQAVTVADGSTQLNAVAGAGYLLDTNAGVIEVTLPSSPTRGDTIKIVDYGGTFATNKCLVNLNGSFLDSTNLGYFNLTTNDTLTEFVYIDSNKGWLFYQNTTQASTPSSALDEGELSVTNTYITATGGTITTSTDYKIHTFTGDGCFVVSAGTGPVATVDYLVVAGGGGGAWDRAGGGGAGGFRESHSTPVSGCYTASPLATPTGIRVSATTYPVTVGGGGVGDTGSPTSNLGTNGSNSVFSTITSAGGGKGASGLGGANNENGYAGGSGGGGAAGSALCSTGGTGNTPPVSPPQGNNGGNVSTAIAGAGGGGATAAGGPISNTPSGGSGGAGGAGATTSISDTPTAYAGGGGGGAANPGSGGAGGSGVGGPGAPAPASSPVPSRVGTANRGGGGGGGNQGGGPDSNKGAAGGKGIVIIRYKFQ
jgi:hypothetical protein